MAQKVPKLEIECFVFSMVFGNMVAEKQNM